MLVAAWWVASGLEGRSTRVGSLIVLDHVAPVLIVSLLAVIVGWLGITAWAARECRHRIRARSLSARSASLRTCGCRESTEGSGKVLLL
jgi:hypothetical protein